MKPNIKIQIATALAIIVCGFWQNTFARPNVKANGLRTTYDKTQLRTTATASCKEAQAAIDLDINNVRARLMTGGDMWWNIGIEEASYEVPKGTKKSSLFAGSVWIGGYDPQGQLKVAAQTYRQDGNDYWPGPLNSTNEIDAATCAEWDKFWKVDKASILAFRDLIAKGDVSTATNDPRFDDINKWPATGNDKATSASGANLNLLFNTRSYAPFVDVNSDGKYNTADGDYPDILGDQYIWWVFNDKGNIKNQTQTDAIGLEVQASAFAFSTKNSLNDATFYRYRLINRGSLSLDSAYISTWSDADLGYAFDDYIGCDTVRGLGILYNGNSVDGTGQTNSYGSQVPMVGIDFFEGPKKYYKDINNHDTFRKLKMEGYYYYDNNFGVNGNPSNGQQIYGYMTGTNRGGQRFSYDWNGAPGTPSKGFGSGPIRKYVFYGDPSNSSEWSECVCANVVGDRRFIHSAGPFKLEAGTANSQNDVTIGAVWTPNAGGCPNTSFTKIRAADDLAQELFDSGFKNIEGPEAPRAVVRELDRKVVFYLINDPISNNYEEKYGRSDSLKYHAASNKSKKHADSLYKFEGYRVFQLKNSQITAAQIFNDKGEINTDVAFEIKEASSDVQNGVGTIVNWTKQDLGKGNDSTWSPVVKVNGRDSGIVHSFQLQNDNFATGTDKRLVNYKNYYFTVIAYAYNDFGAKFDQSNGTKTIPSFNGSTRVSADSTQDVPYLESAHGQGGIPIPVYAVMPNPAAGNMGTYLNSDYGDGVVIKRIEGIGNGGNSLQISKESENEAISGPAYQSHNPIYQGGQGPIDVMVVDPVKVPKGNWELYISGKQYSDTTKGIIPDSGMWKIVKDGSETIYSERSLAVLNEQLLEKYGLSVSIKQVVRPGDDQINNQNGLIASSVAFAEPGRAWLSGVTDEDNESYANWIRSGNFQDILPSGAPPSPCNWKDNLWDTAGQFYERLFSDNSLMKASWAPYAMASAEKSSACGFGVIRDNTARLTGLNATRSVDLVFTSDKSKWTKCVVLEMQDEPNLAQNKGTKFKPRRHASWDGNVDNSGLPVYNNSDSGKSWFPGYAVDQETGERLNIAFGEDSWLKEHNGSDMIWNPSSTKFNNLAETEVIFGGKHYIYILSTKYDEGIDLYKLLTTGSELQIVTGIPRMMMWVGIPLLNKGFSLLPLKDGLIPTETRLRFRVSRPYTRYTPDVSVAPRNDYFPLYSFNTDNLAPSPLSDAGNPYANDKQKLLDRIQAVPNPYYGYAGYENNRLDTRIKIINLPQKATVSIYSLDGSLVRKLTKDNPNVSYLEWDIKNFKSLPLASGMYLIHVNAEGIGETVIRWFGAMRPIDVTRY